MEESSTKTKPSLLVAISVTGLIAGTLDITAACTQYFIKTGNGPIRVLEYVASGVFGKEQAFSGNSLMAVAGLLFHYTIAFGWTTLFFLLYPKLSFLRGNRVVVIVGYGIFVWAMMNQVVVPLSRVPQGPFNISGAIQAALILIACISLPITTMARRFYSAK